MQPQTGTKGLWIAGIAGTGIVIAVVLAIAAFGSGGGIENDAGEDQTTTTTTGTTTTAGSRSDIELPTNLEIVSEDWITDFTKTIIDFDELAIGIRALPIRDRIRPIDEPRFDLIADADEARKDREPGLIIDLEDDARFYPLAILTSHEIVNDVVGEVPVAITYCPLCNSAIVFDRRLDGVVHRFGVSGLLRNSDLVMWDNVTESLWQQLTGEGLVGEYAGRQLEFLPSSIGNYADFKRQHPDGLVLSQDQGFGHAYGFNPYTGYSSRPAPYSFFDGNQLDPRLPALERVVNVTIGDVVKAYPFSVLEVERAVNDRVGDTDVVVLWGGDTADALDRDIIALSANIGTAIALSPVVDGKVLTFTARDETTFTDAETGSVWDLNGVAIEGPLAGTELEKVVHGNEFWFAWAAFHPDGAVYGL